MRQNVVKHGYTKIIDIGATSIFLCIAIANATSILFMFLSPNASPLFGSVCQGKVLCVLFVTALHIFSSIIHHCNVYLAVMSIFYPMITFFLYLLPEFKLGKKPGAYLLSEDFRHPTNFTLLYRTSQILFIQFNEWIGRLLIPTHAVATLFFIFSSYVVIRHEDQMDMVPLLMILTWAIATPVAWSIILYGGGYLHFHTNKCINSWTKFSWKFRRDRNHLKSFAKSCKPMAICYGKMYVIRKMTLIVFIQGLTRGLVRALLTIC